MPHPDPWPRWAAEPVVVVDHDPTWADRAVRERDLLLPLLEPWLIGAVEHIGSTAVPGLAAKPIIDLQAPVAHLSDAGAIAAVLVPYDRHFVPPELDRRPHRRFLVQVADDRRVGHLHLLTPDSDRRHEQVAFRDALRADPVLAGAYAALKLGLARDHAGNREAYGAAEGRFVRDALAAHPGS